tara:strand:+ start:101 stop:535 length:435 start_codon:yes stop_codon:yes gene_type:complete
MKITRTQLKELIKEVIKRSLSEERGQFRDPDMASKIQNVFDEYAMPYGIELGDSEPISWSSALYSAEFAILKIDSESTARNLIKLLGAKVPGFDSYIFKMADVSGGWRIIARDPSITHGTGSDWSGYMSFNDVDDGKEINWKKM